MSESRPAPTATAEDLRAEYSVLGSYTTAMTGARFQTLAIYLAAIGLIVGRRKPRSLEALLILLVSGGLWILDVRNRDVLARMGKRGRAIECTWRGATPDAAGAAESPAEPGRGFFLDESVPPRFRFLMVRPVGERITSHRWASVFTHAVGIDVVFLGVGGYALAILSHVSDWSRYLIALAPLLGAFAAALAIDAVRSSGAKAASRAHVER